MNTSSLFSLNNSVKNLGFIGESRVKPLLTQVRTAFFSEDCGMCYVIRLCDGRFIIIDANSGEYEESERLFDVLNSQNVNEKIVIAAWFFTHSHHDHIGGFAPFLSKHKTDVVIENIFYNWPKEDKVCALDEYEKTVLASFEKKIDEIQEKTSIITAHSGNEYVFGGVTFKILFDCEDLYPNFIHNFNDSSLVLTAHFGDYKILFLGDAQKQAADFICQKYDAEALKCNILQVGHHGYGGGSDSLYHSTDPDALLWPCPNFWFPIIKNWEPNEFLLTSPKIKHTYLSGREQTTIDLTAPLPEANPYKSYKKGEKICNLDFSANRVIDLNLSCITGGRTGYKAAIATLRDGKLTLKTSDAESYCVCEFVQQGLLEKNLCYTINFSGKICEGFNEFGLFWDYEKPTVFNESKVLKLSPTKNKHFSYSLKCNGEEKAGELYLDGKLIKRMSCEHIGGLHFVLKNATLILDKFEVIKS